MNRLVLFLVFTSSVVLSAETKRPSWSLGLPEQQQVPVTITSKVESEDSQAEVSLDQPDIRFGIESLDTDMMMPIEIMPLEQNYQPELQVRHEVKTASEAEVVEEEIIAEVIKKQSEPIETKELVHSEISDNAVYSWQIIRQFPIKVSAVSISNRDSLLVKVIINNQGEIVGVDRVLDDTTEGLMQTVERSLKRWKFAAPETEGIDVPYLSRVFKVALTAR